MTSQLPWRTLMGMRLSFFITTLFLTTSVQASGPDLFGFGGRATGLAGTVVSHPLGHDAVYHNPAGLLLLTAPQVHVGYTYGQLDLNIDDRLQDTHDISASMIGVSLPLPLRGALKDTLALGLGFVIPTNTVLRAYLPRPGTPYFPVEANGAQTVTLQAALAYKPVDFLRIGAGFMALSALNGRIDVAPNSEGRIGSSARTQLVGRYAPILGIHAQLSHSWGLGLVYRGQSTAEFDLPLNADLGDGFPLPIPTLAVHGTAQFDPRQIEFELGWRHEDFWLAAGVNWNQWSRFPQPIAYAARPDIFEPLPIPDWQDTLEVSLGMEIPWKSVLAGCLRWGYRLVPAPSRSTQPAHALLTNDRHVVAMGHTLNWHPWHWTIGLQWHQLMERASRQIPLDAADPVMYRHQGFLWVANTEIGLEL